PMPPSSAAHMMSAQSPSDTGNETVTVAPESASTGFAPSMSSTASDSAWITLSSVTASGSSSAIRMASRARSRVSEMVIEVGSWLGGWDYRGPHHPAPAGELERRCRLPPAARRAVTVTRGIRVGLHVGGVYFPVYAAGP